MNLESFEQRSREVEPQKQDLFQKPKGSTERFSQMTVVVESIPAEVAQKMIDTDKQFPIEAKLCEGMGLGAADRALLRLNGVRICSSNGELILESAGQEPFRISKGTTELVVQIKEEAGQRKLMIRGLNASSGRSFSVPLVHTKEDFSKQMERQLRSIAPNVDVQAMSPMEGDQNMEYSIVMAGKTLRFSTKPVVQVDGSVQTQIYMKDRPEIAPMPLDAFLQKLKNRQV